MLTVLPRFAEPVNNVTVVAGRDATLHCVVDNLQKFKVVYTFHFVRENPPQLFQKVDYIYLTMLIPSFFF